MSLHKFADMVAKQGRGEDSLLIHMTPDEVQRLQSFAQANGRSLTINPDTGLPEAGMLSDLFKAVAPIALGAFLGPGAFGIAGMGLSAGMAGAAVGGITTLATGSLSRGLMAGLGAYGGAGLAEGLSNLGAGELAQGQISANMPTLAENATQAQIEAYTQQVKDLQAAGLQGAKMMPLADKLSAGVSSAMASPTDALAFAKQNMMPLAAAATPIMAGAMVPTTTKMPENTNPAYVRQKLYDPYTQTYKSLAPVKATDWGSRNFSDAYTNPQTGIASALDVRQPTPMAGGGIVALAGGGVSDQQVVDWFKANPGAKDTDIAAAMQQFNVDPAQVARATGTQDKQADYEQRYQTATNQNILDYANQAGPLSTATTGGTGTAAIADWMDTHGINAQEYAKALASTNPSTPYTEQGIQALYNTATKVGNQADVINAASPIKDIHDPRNDKSWAAWMDANKVGVSDAARAFGLSDAEVKERYDLAKQKPIVKTTTPAAGIARGTYGNTTTDPRTTTPGDITTNPDQTVTVTPNIPGRPTGGFTGVGQVKDAYTAGGGSLGYIPKAPKTIDEFNQMYNQQTGDSLAAYNYLMGIGGAKYPIQSVAASTGINRPYWTDAMRYKPKFLTTNPDGTISSSETKGSLKAFTDPNTPPTTPARTGYSWAWNSSFNKWEEVPDLSANQGGGEGGGSAPGPGSGDGGIGTGPGTAKQGGLMKLAQGGISGDGNLNLHIPLEFGGGGGGGMGGFGGGTPIPMSGTGTLGTTGGAVNPNTAGGGYGYADRPDESGGLYKGSMPSISGYDDTITPDIAAANAANQEKNMAAQSYAAANPATASSLAKGLGLFANGGMAYAMGGGLGSLGGYSDGGRLLKGPGDGVSDSIPATIGSKQQPARLADGEFVVPARIVSELGNGSTEAGARKLYAMMDRVQKARGKTTGKNKVAANTRADKHLPA